MEDTSVHQDEGEDATSFNDASTQCLCFDICTIGIHRPAHQRQQTRPQTNACYSTEGAMAATDVHSRLLQHLSCMIQPTTEFEWGTSHLGAQGDQRGFKGNKHHQSINQVKGLHNTCMGDKVSSGVLSGWENDQPDKGLERGHSLTKLTMRRYYPKECSTCIWDHLSPTVGPPRAGHPRTKVRCTIEMTIWGHPSHLMSTPMEPLHG